MRKFFRQFFTVLLMALIYAYRATLGWLLGGRCRFHPTCSQYGLEALAAHGPFYGAWLTLKRLARCQPFTKGGYHPVPLKKEKTTDAHS